MYKVVVEGDLAMHGVTNRVKVNGTLEVKSGKVIGKAKFIVAPKDYDIAIPKAVVKNIAESIEIDVNVAMDKLAK